MTAPVWMALEPERRPAKLRGRGREYMGMDVRVEPDWDASPSAEATRSTLPRRQAAGPMGFAGTARTVAAVEATGLATLDGDAFGGGLSEPLVPGTWES